MLLNIFLITLLLLLHLNIFGFYFDAEGEEAGEFYDESFGFGASGGHQSAGKAIEGAANYCDLATVD